MADNLPPIPPVPASITDPAVRQYLESLAESVSIRAGQRGDPLDRAVTVRELLNNGVAQLLPSAISSHQFSPVPVENPFTVLTPPETPVNFEAFPNPRSVVLTWSKYQVHTVAHAEIFRSETDDFEAAVSVGVSPGQSYADTKIESEKTYYYWLRYVSYANVPSAFYSLDSISATVPLISESELADINVDKLVGNVGQFVEANINDGSITNAKIGNEIKSDNYAGGSAGWLINKFGQSEFHSIKARGEIDGSYRVYASNQNDCTQ